MGMPYWFDGNNLIGQSVAAAKEDSRVRREFLSTLSRYRRSGGGHFTVYFDGDDPDRRAAPPGVSVRYAAPVSADEEICRRLREIRNPSEVIVVTNDHALMRRCRDAGASVLSWDGFVSRMSKRRVPGSAREPEETVNVEEWLKYFGLDKSQGGSNG